MDDDTVGFSAFRPFINGQPDQALAQAHQCGHSGPASRPFHKRSSSSVHGEFNGAFNGWIPANRGEPYTLAESAGGDASRPAVPETPDVRALQMLSGNAQLLQIHAQKDTLAAKLAAWKKSAEAITKRWHAWQRLMEFQVFGDGLPEAVACAQSTAAINTGRTLLTEPDPVPELTKQLTTALRTTLGTLQANLAAAFTIGHERLATSQVWSRLSDEQRATLTTTHQLTAPVKEPIGTDEEIIVALRGNSLPDRRNLLDAVPQRFTRALDEASQLLEPKAVRVILPSATIKDTAELDQWLADVREQVEEKLKDGPVIL